MSRKLYDQLKSEKSSSSYADRCREINKSREESNVKSYCNHHKLGKYGRATEEEEDELVKYMSNLPGYLERGKRNHEKVLNVGVLDWAQLEQWQFSHNLALHRNSRSSTSSNPSSSVSTNRLSGHSCRDRNCCPSGQKMFRASLQDHFISSPMQGHPLADESSRNSVANHPNFRGSHRDIGGTQSKYVRADYHLSLNHPNNRMKECGRKSLDPYMNYKSGAFPNNQLLKAASRARLEVRTHEGVLEKRVETSKEPNIDTVVQGTSRKSKPAVGLLPSDRPQTSHCGVRDKRSSLGQKSENYSRLSASEKPKELFYKDANCDISHSSPLPDELSCNDSQPKESGCSSADLESIKLLASTFSSPLSTFSSPLSVKMGTSPSRSRKSDETKQTIPKTASSNGRVQGLDKKVTSEKSRSSSPFRRLSISIGYTSKGLASKEGKHVQHPSPVRLAAQKSNSQNVTSSNTSGSDKPGDAGTGRSRSSPLRRLLDPLLKSKSAKSRHSSESSRKDSKLINKNCRSSHGNSSILKPVKEVDTNHRVGFSTGNTAHSSIVKKHTSSMTQALLRIAVRNGMPLFTFAVDHNDSNILAATVKNIGGLGKDEFNCVYTFYTFREVKKMNGSWMNQAGRSKGPDYIPHVVAQMKVSNSHNYDLTGQGCIDSSTVKEFVLFSVKLGEGDAQVNDYQPNDELAAIVVKIPEAIGLINDWHQSMHHGDTRDPIHATVVLPGGVHSLPSKGGPSSLIQRWKSGGSCDCGGWDLACKLKVLANENKACRKPRSSKAYYADQLDLFVQGNGQEQQPVFSFAPFKHGMYSVAFDSSLSLLQAFSICIALVDSKMPYELSGSRNSIEGKNPRETLMMPSEELKAFGKLEDIHASSYVSYPPVSPVGRV